MPELPGSLRTIVSLLRPAFTTPSFNTFSWLIYGFIAQLGEGTVTGMWQAARLAGRLHHSRGHDFFSRARWSTDKVGLRLLEGVVALLVPAGAPLRLALDDTLFRRSGKKVWGSFLHHDPTAGGEHAVRQGNSWVVVGLLVELSFMHRPVCLPVIFRLYRPTRPDAIRPSRPELGRALVDLVCERFPTRRVEILADAAYATKSFCGLPARASITMRLRRDAALYAPAPPKSGTRGRPRVKGEKLAPLAELADAPGAAWQPHTLTRYGATHTVFVLAIDCLWYRVLAGEPVRVVLVREATTTHGFDVALLSTDHDTDAAQVVCRYAMRWAIEVAFQDAKQVIGVGQARNRSERAVMRTVPFGFFCQTLIIVWYSQGDTAVRDVERRRRNAPWYLQKKTPSFQDMLATCRRELIRTQYLNAPTPPLPAQEITPPLSPREDLAA